MASATNYLREQMIAHILDNTSYTSPTDVYLALFTSATDEDGGGDEVTGGSYARQVITFSATTVDGERENDSLSFTDMPATTVEGLAIFDADTGGNMLYYANFAPVSVDASDTYPVNAGVLTVRHL